MSGTARSRDNRDGNSDNADEKEVSMVWDYDEIL